MHTMRLIVSFGMFMFLIPTVFGQSLDEEVSVKSTVQKVILYRGQALVTRSVSVQLPEGNHTVLVSELPKYVLPNSLYAEGDSSIEVRAVRYRSRIVGEEPIEEVKNIDLEIRDLDDRINRLNYLINVIAQRTRYIDQMEQFSNQSSKQDLSNGVLKASELQQITEFIFKQRSSIAEESLALNKERSTLTEQKTRLQSERAKLTAGKSETIHEALIFIEKKQAGTNQLKLNYIVQEAGWYPSYTFHYNDQSQNMTIEYNALIQQMTGEAWNRVELTLSTASPALNAKSPGLAPFKIALSSDSGDMGMPASTRSEGYASANRRLREAEKQQQVMEDSKAVMEQSWVMNEAVNYMQHAELIAEKDDLQVIKTSGAGEEQGPSISYDMSSPVSLASRSDQQMIRIAEVELPTTFYYVAAPVLTSYVYREAELINDSKYALLAGSVHVYLSDQFVGRAEIPTVAQGQTFTIGLGVDSQIRTIREIVDKSKIFQGGNQVVENSFRLSLENYKQSSLIVRLYDRIPVPENPDDVKVTFMEMDNPISKDEIYLRLERPKGVIRWDVEVPAQAFGDDTKIIHYGYKMEYDKNMQVVIPSGTQIDETKEEFMKLESSRALH